MQKYADYIQKVEIDSLWSGKKHIVWELNPRVSSEWFSSTFVEF